MIIAQWAVPVEVRQHCIANVAVMFPSCAPGWGGTQQKRQHCEQRQSWVLIEMGVCCRA